MKKITFAIALAAFFTFASISCSQNNEEKIYKKLFLFEQKMTNLIRTSDTEEFINLIIKKDISEDEQKVLKEISFIYEFTPGYIKNAIQKKGAIYRRIFADNKKSLSSYLPSSGLYDVDITMYNYRERYVADIKYASSDEKELYSIEFVLIYFENEWHILTINFFY